MKRLALDSIRIRHFKAIEDSGQIKLTPLTVLIGENGSGKSSLIEALETLQTIVIENLDDAMRPWKGFNEIWHKGVRHDPTIFEVSPRSIAKGAAHERSRSKTRRITRAEFLSNPMTFNLRGRGIADDQKLRGYGAEVELTRSAEARKLVILREEVSFADWWTYTRDHTGSMFRGRNGTGKTGRGNGASHSSQIDPIFHKAPSRSGVLSKLDPDGSLLSEVLYPAVFDWQFHRFVAEKMGEPTALSESGAEILLDKDGANIAEYLLQIREKDGAAFRGIVETLQYVLPSATDVATALTDELEKQVYLKVSEFGYEIPGWLLSSGTIRILAILGLLRHPQPQPLIVVEEIENGLDPRAAQLILEEIRSAVGSGKVQVILTTHSPYLLNLVPLDSVILVERISGKSVFSRPAGRPAVSNWAEKYAPGELYTMGVLNATDSNQ